MPQIFHPSMNTLSRVSIFGGIFIILGVVGVMAAVVRSPYFTEVGVVREQPVPFSHAHHTGDIGIDCRYCHTSVETGAYAGIPPTSTCMTCHAHLWNEAAVLAPVRESYRTKEPLRWTRVHDLPDYAYFNHSIHIAKGVACVSCHGDVSKMPLMWREHTLHMQWCLDCHRNPWPRLAPLDEVYNPEWKPEERSLDEAHRYVDFDTVQSKTDCYTCHR